MYIDDLFRSNFEDDVTISNRLQAEQSPHVKVMVMAIVIVI